ncbi:class I SAM-dependent methyltransferase [Spirobacillus cienkowskii]|uniref:class I SAM-dependent methyltransferase n=1 Tax=Spirobacillus cienkowskii TaxID=495820 RepID=UPI0030D20F53
MSKYFIQTLNKTGYALSEVLDEISQNFIESSKSCTLPVLEIGAAFGVVSLECLKQGATVIANDIDENHLKILKNNANINSNKLILMPCDFEDIKLLDNSISSIFCARVIHFFDPDKLIRCLKLTYKLLENHGTAYFTAETPFLKNWNHLHLDFKKRIAQGDIFAGYVKTKNYINSGEISDNLPEYMQFFDDYNLKIIFEKCGFIVEKSFLFARPYFPLEVQLDGRESVGIIARKIVNFKG